MNRILITAIAILSASLIGSLLVIKNLHDKYVYEQTQKQEIQKAYGQAIQEIKVYKNKNGQLVFQNETLTLDRKNLLKMINDGYLPQLKELSSVKKSLRNLESLVQINAVVEGTTTDVKVTDTTKNYVNSKGDTASFVAREISYKDKWTEIWGAEVAPKQYKLHYETEIPLTGAVYWSRKRFLGKKTYKAEITTENPHGVIRDYVNIRVSKR